jgi:hypothetical protein
VFRRLRPNATAAMTPEPLRSYGVSTCRDPNSGQGKTEAGSSQSGFIIGFNVAIMRFNDGSADRQAHAHADVLCRKEAFKKMREVRRIYARAAIFDNTAHYFGIGLPAIHNATNCATRSPARLRESASRRDLQAAPGSDLQSLFEMAHQFICSEWLSEQADCAAGGRFRFQPRLSTRGNHDDWDSRVTSHEQSHEIKRAHAGHLNVGDDTVTRGSRLRREKLFGGCKPARAVSQRTERLDERHSEWFVIVDDRN